MLSPISSSRLITTALRRTTLPLAQAAPVATARTNSRFLRGNPHPATSSFFLMGSKMSTSSTVNSDDIADFIKRENEKHQVVVWSKSYCPFCTQTKNLFQNMGSHIQVVTHELDRMDNGSAIQNQLAAMTGQRSVPNVFVNNTHVGGNDDTHAAARSGTLTELLAK